MIRVHDKDLRTLEGETEDFEINWVMQMNVLCNS